jgi:hypothetical protein
MHKLIIEVEDYAVMSDGSVKIQLPVHKVTVAGNIILDKQHFLGVMPEPEKAKRAVILFKECPSCCMYLLREKPTCKHCGFDFSRPVENPMFGSAFEVAEAIVPNFPNFVHEGVIPGFDEWKAEQITNLVSHETTEFQLEAMEFDENDKPIN